MRQRQNKEALALLAPDLPASLADSDVAVWREMTQGAAYTLLLQFPEAERHLSAAEDIARASSPNLLGEVALRKGTLAYWRGDMTSAESMYRDALQIARAQGDPFLEVAALGSLGLVATEEERYDESIDWNRAALTLSQSVGNKSSTAKILGNTGWAYFQLGDTESALDLFGRAAQASAEAGSMDDVLKWRLDIGDAYFAQRDFQAATDTYQNALQLARNLDDQGAITEGLENLALVDLERGDFDSADHNRNEILQFVKAHPDHYVSLYALLIAARIELGRQHLVQAEQLLQSILHDPDAESSLRWEAQARLATLYADAHRPSDADREFRKSVNTVEAARSSIRNEELRISFLTNAAELYDDYLDFLVARNKTQDALRVAAQTRAQTLLEGLGIDPAKESSPLADMNWNQVARRENATILCYWLGSRHSYLWAIAPSGQLKLFTLPSRDQIDAAVESYAAALLGPRDVIETAGAAGAKLYTTLIAPAKNLIPRGSRVIIVPDGSLCGLNFETLLAPDPKPHYWIEDAVVTYADSLLLLAAERHSSAPAHGKLLLIGDPVSPNEDFPPLPQAAAEMTSIQKDFPPAATTVLSGNAATPESYLHSRPGQFSFIHFVAHATSSRMRPLESAVVLSKEGDSFKLYGREIVQHPLKAELVTISACHGAGSRYYAGEGLVGLSWAFLRAGARGVIAALWDVNDASTATLMDRLYSEMSEGKNPAVALRDAKLSLLHSGTVYQKPFYWAPFQYYMGL
ncbi:MAG TPA: CHAT domain-containing protein [Candidatus Acidoferrum sp.]|nr:CHAT domain-containing protein [Candidatus Acidoferrum sp.]